MTHKKKKAPEGSGERTLLERIDDGLWRLYEKIPVWRSVGRMEYRWIPGDMISYWQDCHPEGWHIFTEWIVPVISSVIGAAAGLLIMRRWVMP